MIYTIILLACLAADPTNCRTHERPIEASVVPTAAFMDAQSYVAWWQSAHPKWRVMQWRIIAGRSA